MPATNTMCYMARRDANNKYNVLYGKKGCQQQIQCVIWQEGMPTTNIMCYMARRDASNKYNVLYGKKGCQQQIQCVIWQEGMPTTNTMCYMARRDANNKSSAVKWTLPLNSQNNANRRRDNFHWLSNRILLDNVHILNCKGVPSPLCYINNTKLYCVYLYIHTVMNTTILQ